MSTRTRRRRSGSTPPTSAVTTRRSGVAATNDADALIALAPDACSYSPIWPSVDELSRLLEAGINVCSTSAFITGSAIPPADLDRLRAAAVRGNSTLFGTGINPGFANLFGLVERADL